MSDYDLYSGGWNVTPNGGAQYRIHFVLRVMGQDYEANTTDLYWSFMLEKDRSFNGFYGYPASWGASIGGVTVILAGGIGPSYAWPSWNVYEIGSGRITVPHNADGTTGSGIVVHAEYQGADSGWAIGTTGLTQAIGLPAIPRATVATVSPSPASVGNEVTIALPRKVGSYTHDVTWVAGAMNGTIGTGLGTGTTWTVPNVMSQFGGKPQGPITIKVVTKNGSTIIGQTQVSLQVRAAPKVISDPSTDPAKQFDIRARPVKFISGTWGPGAPLPASAITLVDPASATATCTLSVSGILAQDFPDYSIVDIDVFNGNDWIFTNHRLVLSRAEGDEIDPAKMKNYSGTEFVDHLLGFAQVPVDYVWGEENFAPATTPGEMMRYAIRQAKDRGWGPRIEIEFDGSKTSTGEPWANTGVKRRFTKGTPLSQMLSGLVEDGLVEYRTEYRDNMAYLILLNPGTGSNYATVNANPMVNFGLAKLDRAPRRNSSEKRLTRVTVAGDDKIQITRQRAAFDSNVFGQMEGWVAASGVTTNEAAGTIGDNALRDNASANSERTFEYSANSVAPTFFPYYVFDPGDWVLIPDVDNSVTDRISQITVAKTLDGTKLTVLTGDRILSGTASLAKRQNAQNGGSIPGGTQVTPAPLDSRIPNEVMVTAVSSSGYWTVDGAPRAKVTLSWAKVTQAMNGAAINVDLYEVYWRNAAEAGEWAFRAATSQLTIDIPGWEVATTFEFRVRAKSTAGVYGVFSENKLHTTGIPAVDLQGPVIQDLYTDGVGTIYIVWGGLIGSDPYPRRLAYVAAEVSTNGGTTWKTTGNQLSGPGTIALNVKVWGDYLVRLRPYDKLGNPGTATAPPQAISLTDPHIAPKTPNAPTNLASSAGSGWDENGITPDAWFDLTWDAPTTDTEGGATTIVGYDVWGKLDSETIMRFITSTNTNSVRVFVKQGETWSFQVNATSQYGGVSSFSPGIVDTADAPLAPPDAPDAPTLSQYAGLLRVEWSGNGMVPQVKYVFASISTNPLGPFTRAGMPLIGAGEIVIPGLATEETYYAKINMVDEVGQISSSDVSDPLFLQPITGVTIQTSELANTGIKMTNSALTSYDVSGNPTFILDAITGEVWIAPYEAVFNFGATGKTAQTGVDVIGLAISSDNSSFNTFFHPSGMQIRNDQTPLSWWEADAADANLVNFVSPRARINQRLQIGDYEALRESKSVGSRLVFRYKGA